MKAMIFAAGLGTRLRPLTDHTPKALVPIAGKTMLERVILRLKDAGFNDITINIHHFGEQIIEFLRTHNDFGATIHISDERDRLLDTGGGIKESASLFGRQRTLSCAQCRYYLRRNLADFYRHHRESNAEATLLVSERQTSRYLLLDDDNLLHGWINKSTGETKPGDFVFQEGEYREMAFWRHSCHIPFHFPPNGKCPMGREIFHYPFLSVRLQDNPYTRLSASKRHWFDISKPETLEKAENYLIESALK